MLRMIWLSAAEDEAGGIGELCQDEKVVKYASKLIVIVLLICATGNGRHFPSFIDFISVAVLAQPHDCYVREHHSCAETVVLRLCCWRWHAAAEAESEAPSNRPNTH